MLNNKGGINITTISVDTSGDLIRHNKIQRQMILTSMVADGSISPKVLLNDITGNKTIENELIDISIDDNEYLMPLDCAIAVKLATEEIGITENLNEKGEGTNTGKMEKYGGEKGDPWCASFVSWLYGKGQGKNNDDTFGYQIAVSNLRQQADDAGYYGLVDEYEPQPGDIMIQKENGASHTGMVIKADNEYIYTVEGNAGDAVRAKKYSRNGKAYKKISGYIKMNEWAKNDNLISVNIKNISELNYENADDNIKQSTR